MANLSLTITEFAKTPVFGLEYQIILRIVSVGRRWGIVKMKPVV